jgi:hypothetical protein
MTYRSRTMHSRILASTLASLLGIGMPALVVGGITLNPSVVEAAVTEATCRIHAVEARQDGDGTIPADLAFLTDQLQAPEFARYKGFALLDAKDFKLELGKVVDQKFKSGHNLQLSLIGGELDKLELHTNLMRGSKSLVDMTFVVGSNQIVLIPVRRGDQTIIFAYQCKG